MNKLWMTLIIAAMLLTACSGESKATPTLDPVALGVAATIAAQNSEATRVALFTPTPTATEVPTVTPSPTPTEMPIFATAIQNAACRLGPYVNFDRVETLDGGLSAEIIGQMNTNGQWWKVRLTSGNECWVFADQVSVTKNTSKIAFVDSPPTPTPPPAPAWGGTWNIVVRWPGNADALAYPSTTTISQNGNQLSGFFNTQWGRIDFSGQLNPKNPSEAWLNLIDKNWPNHPYTAILYKDPNDSKQFRGHITTSNGITGEFCGSRDGIDLPSSCMQ